MTTKPYSSLLAQVEALAGATLATQEQARVKIFANRRAKDAHRECPYWPRFLRVGEERIVSSTGLLPLAESGKETIDQIIRIHAEDPFKSTSANEYTEYYHDSTGIQITGYQLAESSYGTVITVAGALNPDVTGDDYTVTGTANDYDLWTSAANPTNTISVILTKWYLGGGPFDAYYWESAETVFEAASPDLVTSWTAGGTATGTPTVTADQAYSAFITYIAAPADTYGDGDGEEADIPEEWFEYMAQGAYCDWLRSDGQTEKALNEELIAAKLLNQQLEKVSRQNGNQVITRNLNHANMQRR